MNTMNELAKNAGRVQAFVAAIHDTGALTDTPAVWKACNHLYEMDPAYRAYMNQEAALFERIAAEHDNLDDWTEAEQTEWAALIAMMPDRRYRLTEYGQKFYRGIVAYGGVAKAAIDKMVTA